MKKKMSSIIFMFILLFFVIVTFILVCKQTSGYNQYENDVKKHRVILIVLDALRHDYLEIAKQQKLDLLNLNRFAQDGARVMKIMASTPTVTMPNHQTLITGLYSPYHGITYNTFNDTKLKSRFSMGNQNSLNEKKWYQGYPDPIWVTCELTENCRSGSMLWPNTDAEIHNVRPYRSVDQYIVLNDAVIYPYERRVDGLVNWIKNDMIDFGLLYFDQPDVTAHKMGPLHRDTLNIIKKMDGYIGDLLNKLEAEKLLSQTDIIITADHGMTQMSKDRIIDLDKFIHPQNYTSTYLYPVGIIYPKKGLEEKILKKLNTIPHIRAFKRDNVPLEAHYRDNKDRISPIVTFVDQGWSVKSSKFHEKSYMGMHGFDRSEDDMKATFLAMGPSFKAGARIPSMENVDVYPLMMHLLGIPPLPCNGSLETTKSLLSDKGKLFVARRDRWSFNRTVIFIYIIFTAQIILFALIIISLCIRRSLD